MSDCFTSKRHELRLGHHEEAERSLKWSSLRSKSQCIKPVAEIFCYFFTCVEVLETSKKVGGVFVFSIYPSINFHLYCVPSLKLLRKRKFRRKLRVLVGKQLRQSPSPGFGGKSWMFRWKLRVLRTKLTLANPIPSESHFLTQVMC
jgi:hypothetical protein